MKKNYDLEEIEKWAEKGYRSAEKHVKMTAASVSDGAPRKNKKQRGGFFESSAVQVTGIFLVAVIVCGGVFTALKYLEHVGAEKMNGSAPGISSEQITQMPEEAYPSDTYGTDTAYAPDTEKPSADSEARPETTAEDYANETEAPERVIFDGEKTPENRRFIAVSSGGRVYYPYVDKYYKKNEYEIITTVDHVPYDQEFIDRSRPDMITVTYSEPFSVSNNVSDKNFTVLEASVTSMWRGGSLYEDHAPFDEDADYYKRNTADMLDKIASALSRANNGYYMVDLTVVWENYPLYEAEQFYNVKFFVNKYVSETPEYDYDPEGWLVIKTRGGEYTPKYTAARTYYRGEVISERESGTNTDIPEYAFSEYVNFVEGSRNFYKVTSVTVDGIGFDAADFAYNYIYETNKDSGGTHTFNVTLEVTWDYEIFIKEYVDNCDDRIRTYIYKFILIPEQNAALTDAVTVTEPPVTEELQISEPGVLTAAQQWLLSKMDSGMTVEGLLDSFGTLEDNGTLKQSFAAGNHAQLNVEANGSFVRYSDDHYDLVYFAGAEEPFVLSEARLIMRTGCSGVDLPFGITLDMTSEQVLKQLGYSDSEIDGLNGGFMRGGFDMFYEPVNGILTGNALIRVSGAVISCGLEFGGRANEFYIEMESVR